MLKTLVEGATVPKTDEPATASAMESDGRRGGSVLARRHGVHVGVCGSLPCANGGICVEVMYNTTSSYTCTCTREWHGSRCESPSAEALAIEALTILVGGATQRNGLDRIWGAAPWNSGQQVTPLMVAAYYGWVGGVQALLRLGASASVRTQVRERDALSFLVDGLRNGIMPLSSAAVTASLLLEAGAQPAASSWSGAHGRAERERLVNALPALTRSKLTKALRGVPEEPRAPKKAPIHKIKRGYHVEEPGLKRRPFRDDL